VEVADISKVDPATQRLLSNQISIDLVSVIVLRGIKLNDSINYVRSGVPDPAVIAQQLRSGETNIDNLGALGGLHYHHPQYREEIEKLAANGTVVTSFPRKRAAATRNGAFLEEKLAEIAVAGADTDADLQTLRIFLQYFCSFETLAVIRNNTARQDYEVSLQEFTDAFLEVSTYCRVHQLEIAETGVKLGQVTLEEMPPKHATEGTPIVFASALSNALLGAAGVHTVGRRRRVIQGIRWKHITEATYFTSRFLKEIFIDACIYTMILLIPVVLFIGGGLYAQLVYSITTGRITNSVGNDDLTTLEIGNEQTYFLPTYILIIGALCTTLLLALRILFHYVSISSTNRIYFAWSV
jgi:hypothetical protein